MHWLAGSEDGSISLESLQLDIVGFLAILGEGSVLANAQVSTLSRWIFLPRLIPAPQALMRPTRPTVLRPAPGYVAGTFSGNHSRNINHIGNIVCDASNLAPFSVRVVSIKRLDHLPMKSKALGPLTAVNLVGFLLSAGLLGFSIQQKDGMSIVATCVLSLLSSLIGLGNKWVLQLPKREVKNDKVPRGDVVIRYPKGSFLVVRCEEDVARELYFAPAEINYLLKHAPVYRILSLIGTMMLMGGVICLANAQIQVQIAWAASYMFLGSAYWIVAALPSKLHWDFSCYKVTNECLSDSTMDAKGFPSENKTYTQALWKAIAVAKSTSWVTKNDACPDTATWQAWLRAAREHSKKGKSSDIQNKDGKLVTTWQVPDWNPQGYLAELLKEQAKDDEKDIKTQEEV